MESKYRTKKQNNSKATFHIAKEIEEKSNIDLNKNYKALDLINIIRARSFTNGDSAYFYKNGKKYYIRTSISEAKNYE